uniref:Putative secreted protein n=1 Tax=Anopheles marajoara TaxID=58244 RepID=A0A2M4C6V4_9DIPT
MISRFAVPVAVAATLSAGDWFAVCCCCCSCCNDGVELCCCSNDCCCCGWLVGAGRDAGMVVIVTLGFRLRQINSGGIEVAAAPTPFGSSSLATFDAPAEVCGDEVAAGTIEALVPPSVDILRFMPAVVCSC